MRFLWFSLLASLCLADRAHAQQPLHLTLAAAEQLALADNPQLRSAQSIASAALQVPTEIRANFQPAVSGALTGVEADDGSRLAAGGLNNPVLYSRIGAGLSLTQLVTDFGRTSNLLASARLRAEAQGRTAESTRAQVLLGVNRAYFGALRAEAILKVVQQTVATRRLVADQISALAQSSLRSSLDVSFANVNLSEAQLLLVSTQADVQSAYADLAVTIGLSGRQPQPAFSLEPAPLPGELAESIDTLLDRAQHNRPELASLRLEASAARKFAQAEKDLSRPTVAVAAAAGVAPAGDVHVPTRYGAAGVNVSVPILNGHVYGARETEAALRAKAVEEQVADLANRIVRDVRVAYANASTAYQRVALTAQLLDQARLALDLAQRRYDLGLASIVELSQAQLNVTGAEIAGSSAQFDYQLQRANLSYQVGDLR